MRSLLTILFICCAMSLQAQRFSIQELDDLHVFTTMEEALAKPDSVYRLRLKLKGEIPPEVFTAFPHLHELNLSRSRLSTLPKEIALLKNVLRLIADRVKLELLPPEIGEMESLQELILNRNELKAIPKEIGKLQNLYLLDLWSNNLDDLPASMSKMPTLREVDLRVIVMSDEQKKDIREMLPNVKVHMDKGCNCGK
jgi:Leucine-rich repeat (LRR) protein